MPQLQITIDIADEPSEGYDRRKLDRIDGSDTGAILSRIGIANRQAFPRFKIDDPRTILLAVASAVAVAESEE